MRTCSQSNRLAPSKAHASQHDLLGTLDGSLREPAAISGRQRRSDHLELQLVRDEDDLELAITIEISLQSGSTVCVAVCRPEGQARLEWQRRLFDDSRETSARCCAVCFERTSLVCLVC